MHESTLLVLHLEVCCVQADRDKREALERAEREKTEAQEAAACQLAEQQAAESAKEANLKSTLLQKQQVLLHVVTFLVAQRVLVSLIVLLGEGGWGTRPLALQGNQASAALMQ